MPILQHFFSFVYRQLTIQLQWGRINQHLLFSAIALATLLFTLVGLGASHADSTLSPTFQLGDILIDSFDTAQAQLTRTAPGDVGTPINSVVVGGGIQGGERDLEILLSSAPISSTQQNAQVLGGILTFDHGPLVAGEIHLVYDGPGGGGLAGLIPTGLGGIDITSTSIHNTFRLSIVTRDNPAIVTIRVYTDAANFSTRTISLGGTLFTPQNIDFPFSSFTPAGGTGADFTNVGAIVMTIATNPSDLDMVIDSLVVTGPPQPIPDDSEEAPPFPDPPSDTPSSTPSSSTTVSGTGGSSGTAPTPVTPVSAPAATATAAASGAPTLLPETGYPPLSHYLLNRWSMLVSGLLLLAGLGLFLHKAKHG